MKQLPKWFKIKNLAWILALIAVLGAGFYFLGLSSIPKYSSKSYQMVKQIEKVEETVLLNARIQRIESREEATRIWGVKIPGSEKKALIILNFTAKFGIKEPAKIHQKGEHRYEVTIPQYKVIGFEFAEEDYYQLYDVKKGLLSSSTEDPNTGEMVANSLSNKEQSKYLKDYKNLLNESAESYYRNLIQAIDPEATVRFVFKK